MVLSGATYVVHSARSLAGARTCKMVARVHLGPQVGWLGWFVPNQISVSLSIVSPYPVA